MAKKTKTRTVTARVVGPIPTLATRDGFAWKLRLAAPYLPFYLDSSQSYLSLERAEADAEKWRKRKITITIEK
jgi:hypothetical protein